MKNLDFILSKIKSLKNPDHVTNIFLVGKALKEFILNDKVEVICCEDVIFMVKDTEYCKRVYFFAKNFKSLSTANAVLDKNIEKEYMMDLIGKDGKPEAICQYLSENGFSHYITYGRWSGKRENLVFKRNYTNEDIWDSPLRLATIEDLDRVYEILYDTFDKLAYELQDIETLKQQILNNEVYVATLNNRVEAFFIALRPSEKVCIMDYTAVDKNVRGFGVSLYIMGYVLQHLQDGTSINYYASIENSVTGREKGMYGMVKENFSKILVKLNK